LPFSSKLPASSYTTVSSDVHRTGRRARLDARRGVDEISGDHPLAFGAERDRRLAGEHACTRAQVLGSDLTAECGDGGHEVERRAHGALRVVLGRDGRTPDGHDGVADELLHRPAVDGDDPAADVEVAREQLAHVLRVPCLGQRRETDEVGEEHRDEPPLGGRRLPDCGSFDRQRRAAVAAEGVVRLVDGAATRAGESEGRAAAGAELPAGAVLGGAGGAVHALSV
jgi:hypothetical protein